MRHSTASLASELNPGSNSDSDFFRRLCESGSDCIYVLHPDGGFSYISPSIQDLTGLAVEQMLDDPNAFEQTLTPEDRLTWQRQTSGKLLEPQYLRIRHTDGHLRHIRNDCAQFEDSSGKAAGIRGVLRDVTDEHNVERALEETVQIYRLLTEFSGDAVFWRKPDGSFRFISPACKTLTGYAPAEIMDKPDLLETIVHPEDRAHVLPRLRKGGQAVGGEPFSYRLVRKDGAVRWVHQVTRDIESEESPETGIQFSLRDITELHGETERRRKLEAKIQKSRQWESLGMLAGGIAHDFNNLLAGIVGNAEMVKDDLSPGTPEHESLQMITDAAEHAAHLTRQLLAYAGEGTFISEAIALDSLLENMETRLKHALPSHVGLHSRIVKGLPSVLGDTTQLRQVLIHLLTNAGESYGDNEEGTVLLSNGLRRFQPDDFEEGGYLPEDHLQEGYYHYIRIEDRGCGMDADTRAKAFEPFFSTKFTGRGLGLPAVLGIARAHGGFLQMNAQPGMGTSVTVYLPAKLEQTVPHEPSSRTGSSGSSSTQKPVILIVEDDHTLRNTIKRLLERNGFKAMAAADGVEATQVIENHQVDLAILDMVMPRMSGMEFATHARRHLPHLHILMTSGYEKSRILGEMQSLDVDGFLQKPYRPSLLLQKIREVLNLDG